MGELSSFYHIQYYFAPLYYNLHYREMFPRPATGVRTSGFARPDLGKARSNLSLPASQVFPTLSTRTSHSFWQHSPPMVGSRAQPSQNKEKEMGETKSWDDNSSYAVGGGVIMGTGAGFFFLQASVFAFVGCILLGLGLGLLVASIISKGKG